MQAHDLLPQVPLTQNPDDVIINCPIFTCEIGIVSFSNNDPKKFARQVAYLSIRARSLHR